MKSVLRLVPLAAALAVGAPAAVSAQSVFQASSVTTGSEFNNTSFGVINSINGSGLPSGFTLSDLHASYDFNNHWTTQQGAINSGTAWASFFFATPVGLTHFHLWNHQSNNISADGGYGVTLYDLVLRDAGAAALATFTGVSAIGTAGYAAAQTFSFDRVANVSRVDFVIRDNLGSNDSYTGLGEVAFSDYTEQPGTVTPEPVSMVLLGTGMSGILAARRRRKAH